MTLEQAAKQYSEQNQFVSLTQCFKEVVNSEYVQREKIKFALEKIKIIDGFPGYTAAIAKRIIKELEKQLET